MPKQSGGFLEWLVPPLAIAKIARQKAQQRRQRRQQLNRRRQARMRDLQQDPEYLSRKRQANLPPSYGGMRYPTQTGGIVATRAQQARWLREYKLQQRGGTWFERFAGKKKQKGGKWFGDTFFEGMFGSKRPRKTRTRKIIHSEMKSQKGGAVLFRKFFEDPFHVREKLAKKKKSKKQKGGVLGLKNFEKWYGNNHSKKQDAEMDAWASKNL